MPLAPIDRAVALLFDAATSYASGDALALAVTRGKLVAIAGTIEDFEAQLTMAVVALVAPHLPNTPFDEVERAVLVDVHRHVSNPIFLAQLEPWGHG
jgi:hypothetical protein